MGPPLGCSTYAALLRWQVSVGERTLDDALAFLLDHGVHPRIADAMLKDPDEERVDRDTDALS